MIGPPNCQHLDNYLDCRIFHGSYALTKWLGIRPRCVLTLLPPRDGERTCDEQKPFQRQRPPGPPSMHPKNPPPPPDIDGIRKY